LVEFLESTTADEVVLVGDICDVWWAWRRSVYAAYIPLLGTLWRLTQRGVRVTWVRGNHDFRLEPLTDIGVTVADSWRRTEGVTRYLAVHGDAADNRVRQRFFNRLIRGSLAHTVATAIGPDGMWAMIKRASKVSRDHQGGSARVLKAQSSYVDGLLRRGADVVMVGHTQAPGLLERRDGRLVNLGDWLRHKTWVEIDEAGLRLRQRLPGGDVALDGPPQRRERGA
jgi:UDP-2,3-diacylglucosamine hydrolase